MSVVIRRRASVACRKVSSANRSNRARGHGVGRALRNEAVAVVALGIGLVSPAPAVALTGIELLKDVCIATHPKFEQASERVARRKGTRISYEGALFEHIDVDRQIAWTVRDESGPGPDRFLVSVAWGTMKTRSAASCFVADKKGFTWAELEEAFPIKQYGPRADETMLSRSVDAIIERADGQGIWLVLTRSAIAEDSETQRRFSVATVVSAEFLDSLLRKDR